MIDNADNEATTAINNETVNKLILEIGGSSSAVSVNTSLLEVASILDYLAQCDCTQAGSGSDLPGDLHYGRHYLMQILSCFVYHFYENASLVPEHLNKMLSSIATKNDTLVELHEHYQALIEFPDDGSKLDLDKLKMNIMVCEDSLSLKKSEAIVAYKRADAINEQP